MDTAVVHQLSLETVQLPVPLCVTAIDGRSLPWITHQTKPLRLIISGNHIELIFFVSPTLTHL